MESPVVVDKPPEYHGKNDRGFPFDEEEGTGAWSELAARHPDIAARLRQRPATWARKRRPSSQDAADDFGDGFGGFDRFPFDDIPQEFREHFPTHWNRRFGSREEAAPQQQSAAPQHSPQQQTAGTQTEQNPEPSQENQQTQLPQYGLRNTVDLGQKSPADPSLAESEDRSQRSMSAPPDSRSNNQNCTNNMSGQNHQEQSYAPPQHEQQSNVRHIPIFVEGRDEPVINKSVDHGAHYADTKPTFSPQQQPHIDREQYFADDGPPSFHHTPNFSRAFGTPFNKGYRQGPQPFVQQKVYPQTAFARGGSPQRSQSPKAQMYPEEQFAKVPVHHEQSTPRAETPSRPQQKQQQKQSPQQQQQKQSPPQQQPPPQQHQPPPQQQEPAPQPKPAASANDPITQILSIQTDVLNLMTEVENFTGTKKDKKYMFLDEMLTRNLIKLDNIETDGKENIRLARKEAIKCIQKCIAVLEAKADNKGAATPQPQDVEMKDSIENENAANKEEVKENGEVEMKDTTKDEINEQTQQSEQVSQVEQQITQPQEVKTKEKSLEESKEETTKPQAADTRPEDTKDIEQTEVNDEQKSNENVDKKTPKKGAKTAKKRDKSKDKKETSVNKDIVEDKKDTDTMQVDNKGDKDSQAMEVEGATASQ